MPSDSVPRTAHANSYKAAPAKVQGMTSGLPVHLNIPSINVDAALEYVGMTPQGALEVPATPANAAWYERGPRPGNEGNAVIDGHFGYVDNIPAVFDNLHELAVGDDIYVIDDKSATITFVVSAVQTLGQNQNDSNIFTSKDDKAHLNLITCEGTWNQAQKSYSDRLVVFADKVID